MDNIDDTTNKNRLVSREEKYKGRSGDYVLKKLESTEVDTSTNPVLRERQKDWRDNTDQHRFKKNPDSFTSNDNRNINRFENFEVQGNKPPTVSSKQIYTDVDGEQYYVPVTRTKNSATQHSKEKNIAVDYYFSRMSSGEWPFFEDDVSEVSSTNQKAKFKSSEITDHVGKHIFKTDTEGEHRVMQEKQFQIPLKLDNVLKIDLAMKDNKSKVIFRKVKNTIKKDVDILLNAHLNVLKDMVEYDNEGLLHFDWLGSTVDVQSALKKLISLANIMHVRDDVHRSDKELFRYVLFLFKSALKTLIEAEEFSATNDGIHKTYQRLSKRKTLMPIINTKQFEAWREVKKYMREMRNLNIDIYDYLLNQFEYFLIDLSDSLTELHETIKEIAVVTKFKRQRWYQDLKDLYLSPMNKKVSLYLLLHLASSRLFGLIEESAKNGVEENLIDYVRTHKVEVERTREGICLCVKAAEGNK
ncbi:unnamed protein product, partial [Iphiclides podalirius]